MPKDKNTDMPMVPPPLDGEVPPRGRPGTMPKEGPPPRPPLDGPEDLRALPPVGEVSVLDEGPPPTPVPVFSSWKRFSRVFFGRKVVLVSLILLLLLVLMSIFAPLLAPYPPNKPYLGPPMAQPSWSHWLGTDQDGRDVLSRVIYGGRVSLYIGIVVVVISSVIGIFLGLIAGYYKWLRAPIMRVMDAFMAFPMVLLTMSIAALLGGGLNVVIVALTIGMVPSYVRVMCGMVLQAKENDYVLALRSVGASSSRILYKHILPNCLQPFIVLMTMQLGGVILAESGLSFLGIGVQPPTAAWGSMIADGKDDMLSNPVLSLGPGLVLMILVFSFNMVGDGLRDALDPRLRGMI